ncbi:Peptide transporter family 1 [Gryllus bimaculatus]|nr:Peptide transporter family 1 [Gryllus bimaculatus]
MNYAKDFLTMECENSVIVGALATETILVLYLTSILTYSEDDATVIYHIFAMFCYFFPVLGSMIADSWLGKFKTIFFLSIVYAIGNIIISLASASSTIDIPGRTLTIIGLLLIAFGTGGIKPCVSAFGGDQFILPQQEKQMAQFFSFFYFAINSGSLISTFLTPVLREDVQCFDQSSCYPLAFGVPAVLMIVSILVFVAGKNLYIIKKPQGNVVMQVSKCMGHAIGQKIKSKGPKRDHWLDYADDQYEKKEIEDIKSALRVLYLYLPLPFFWALFDQQGSRWTFQATMMTGALGSWSLKPDQMQVVNPLLILIFIPIFESIIYPLLKKCNLLTKPLQRLGVGGVLAAIAFGISAIVELQLEGSYPVLPGSGQAQLRVFNGLGCEVQVNLVRPVDPLSQKIEPYGSWRLPHLSANGKDMVAMQYANCDNEIKVTTVTVEEKQNLVVHTITSENKVHMLWLIPQYVVMTMGEVMFSITGLEFSYSQAPLSMKSVMQAGWLLTVAFGNLIVVIIAEAKFFDRQLWEFVLFAGLMVVDMLIFALMAMGYQYIEPPHESQDLPLESTEEKRGIDNTTFKRDDE